MDLEWKNTFIKKAKKYQRDIIPVYVEGRNSDWFYNLSVWRKRLGIKANIEMLYLVDEMMKQFNKTITIVVGNPIPYTTFDASKSEKMWAEEVKKQVYKLGTDYKTIPHAL
jgi:putative hemolysin